MPGFNGQLRQNEVFSALYNMIISQEVFADNLSGGFSLVDKARVDGGLAGDTKLYYSTDILKSHVWGADNEANSLLSIDRPAAPACQSIILNKFRQIRVTIDNYLSRRAFAEEGTFSSFNGVMLGWLRETKKAYDETYYLANVCTMNTTTGKQDYEIAVSDVVGSATGEEANRLEAQAIAQGIADLIIDMKNYSRYYNDYGYFRSYAPEKLTFVWNAKFVNKITKLDMPTIFHKDIISFENVVPAEYFGDVISSAGTTASSNTTVRSLIEKDYGSVHVMPGELLPNSTAYLANETYIVDGDVICKIFVKLPVYMSAFETGTSFFNARSLTENHYLTFSHNTMEYFKNYPCVTVHKD